VGQKKKKKRKKKKEEKDESVIYPSKIARGKGGSPKRTAGLFKEFGMGSRESVGQEEGPLIQKG